MHRKIIDRFGMPIALADLINWELSTSFIKVLVTLSKGAPIVIAKVDAGSIIWAKEAKNDSQLPVSNESIIYMPVMDSGGEASIILPIGGGAICNPAKKTKINRVASQNSGIAIPKPERNFAR